MTPARTMTLARTTPARCGLSLVAALLLNLCFPLAGPMPAWRALFAWIGAVPLLLALLAPDERPAGARRRPLWRGFLIGWVFGVAWYAINCYWIYQTMNLYGGLPVPVAAGILLLFSLIMGLYDGLFGWILVLVRRALGAGPALLLAPFLWTAIDLLGAHLIKVPWDQLGYSQIDNPLLTSIAPIAGTYGITFLLLAANALLASGVLFRRAPLAGAAVALTGAGMAALLWQPRALAAPATAVLLQDNVDVRGDVMWAGSEWDPQTGHYVDLYDVMSNRFVEASRQVCTPYIAGAPETGRPLVEPRCDAAAHADLIVWPEAPTPLTEGDPRFRAVMRRLTSVTGAAVIAGNAAADLRRGHVDLYNAASVFAPDGALLGRYSKIHLVPWGEYVPFQQLFSFARGLTRNAGRFTHGWQRIVFRLGGRHYGIFICYESIFADEVRQFVVNGAEVLVNISDDGWYGDTSAPWQHLNMARMRAVENRRWLLRDTNTGVTAAIDPYGRITQSAPRHQFLSLAVRYGFNDRLTFYTRYGDVFALLCGILSVAALARAVRVTADRRRMRPDSYTKSGQAQIR